jgi:hypothetical protein
MSNHTHKLLIILLSLALAVSPLRVAWGLSMTTTADVDSHCAQMQQDKNAADSVMAMDDRNTGSGNPCNEDCNGTCCDGACTSCTPAAPAVSNSALVTPGGYRILLNNNMLSDVFPERTVIPPLRPPAPLHS